MSLYLKGFVEIGRIKFMNNEEIFGYNSTEDKLKIKKIGQVENFMID